MKKERVSAPAPPENVVEDYYIGNTRIIVSDDYYRGQSEERTREILKRVGGIISLEL
jgi:hypothetical protein